MVEQMDAGNSYRRMSVVNSYTTPNKMAELAQLHKNAMNWKNQKSSDRRKRKKIGNEKSIEEEPEMSDD